jgi:hypothetical protein
MTTGGADREKSRARSTQLGSQRFEGIAGYPTAFAAVGSDRRCLHVWPPVLVALFGRWPWWDGAGCWTGVVLLKALRRLTEVDGRCR